MEDTPSSSKADVDEYTRWSNAIVECFFDESKSGRSVRLAFDDQELARVAGRIGRLPNDFVEVVFRLVRRDDFCNVFSFFEAIAESQAESLGGLPFIGLLAAQVLVASEMETDEQFTAQAFWPRFNKLLLKKDDRNPPLGYKRLREFWKSTALQLSDEERGARGILALPSDPVNIPLKGRTHINYPLSQCLVRRADEEALRRLFSEASKDDLATPRSVWRLVRSASHVFGKTFRHLLAQSENSEGLRRELEAVALAVRDEIAGDDFATPSPGEPRRSAKTKSRLCQRHSQVAVKVYLQQFGTEWIDVKELDTEAILEMMDDDLVFPLGGTTAGPVAVFVSTEEGFVTGIDRLPRGTKVRILGTDEASIAFIDSLPAKLQTSVKDIRLAPTLQKLNCLQLPPELETDDKACELLGLHLVVESPIELVGGLPMGRGNRYFKGAPPNVKVRNPQGLVTLNGHPLTVRNDIATIPRDCSLGTHTVRQADHEENFELVLGDASCDYDGDATVGYVVSMDGTFRTQRFPDDDPLNEKPGIRIISGAKILADGAG